MGTIFSSKLLAEREYLKALHCDEDVSHWNSKKIQKLRLFVHPNQMKVSEVTFEMEFQRFVQARFQWEDDTSVLFFRKSWSPEPPDDFLMLCCSGANLSFMCAPIVFQHYLVSLASSSNKKSRSSSHHKYQILDVLSYVKRCWTSERILEFIQYDNAGVDSLQFFLDINLHISDVRYSRYLIPPLDNPGFSLMCEEILEKLSSGKPGLVTHFAVDVDFYHSKEVSFLNDQSFITHQSPSSTSSASSASRDSRLGNQSMLLIGMRPDEQFEYVFLLQTSWKNRFFIEVSAQYFIRCNGIINFIKTEIASFPPNLPFLEGFPYCEIDIDTAEGSFET
jgi:hypothetical protein